MSDDGAAPSGSPPLLIVLNAEDHPVHFELPTSDRMPAWRCVLTSGDSPPAAGLQGLEVEAHCTVVLVGTPDGRSV